MIIKLGELIEILQQMQTIAGADTDTSVETVGLCGVLSFVYPPREYGYSSYGEKPPTRVRGYHIKFYNQLQDAQPGDSIPSGQRTDDPNGG